MFNAFCKGFATILTLELTRINLQVYLFSHSKADRELDDGDLMETMTFMATSWTNG